MNRVAAVRLVLVRELREQLRSRAFQISTAVFVLGVLAGMIIPAVLGEQTETVPVAVTGAGSTEIMLQLAAASTEEVAIGSQLLRSDVEFAPVAVADRAAAVAAVSAGEAQLAIVDGEEIISESQPGSTGDMVTQILYGYEVGKRFTDAGISPFELQLIAAVEPPRVTVLNEEAGEANAILSYISTMLLYVAILTYGLSVAMSVVNEKSSRVVEIVLSTIRPVDLLTGKVLGIGLTGLIQIGAIIVVALVANIFTNNLPLPETGGLAPVLTVTVWFLLGYVFYASVYAVIGSSISKVEDLQGVAFPVMIPILVGFFISFTALEGSETLALRIASFIPFTAPITMPPRMLLGFAANWEVALSLALQLIGVWLVLRLAARVFGGGLLKDRVRLREMFTVS